MGAARRDQARKACGKGVLRWGMEQIWNWEELVMDWEKLEHKRAAPGCQKALL